MGSTIDLHPSFGIVIPLLDEILTMATDCSMLANRSKPIDSICNLADELEELSTNLIKRRIGYVSLETCIMFKKPFALSTRTPLKASAAKKLKDQLKEWVFEHVLSFECSVMHWCRAFPRLVDADIDILLPPKHVVTVDKCSNRTLIYWYCAGRFSSARTLLGRQGRQG